MKMTTGEKIVYALLIISLAMVNPPILGIINDYAAQNPMTFGQPTLLVWLNSWYTFGIVVFLIACLTLKSWKRTYKEEVKR